MKQGEWIKARRIELNKTTRELGSLIGITCSAISNIENHGVIPNLRVAFKLAVALDRPTDWILTGKYNEHEQLNDIPIIGNTEDIPEFIPEKSNCYNEFVNFSTTNPDKYYALRVVGDSMSPRVIEGEVIIVDRSLQPQTGEDVVVKLQTGETMIKTLASIRSDKIFLDSINSSFKRIIKNKDELLYMHAIVAVARSVMTKHL